MEGINRSYYAKMAISSIERTKTGQMTGIPNYVIEQLTLEAH